MPTYEYRCTNGHEFEQFQRMSDEPIGKCPQCGAPAERVLSGGAGLLFKGSGFYITDYRSDSYKKAAASDTASGSAEKSDSGSKDKPDSSKGSTESKPASTTKPAATND